MYFIMTWSLCLGWQSDDIMYISTLSWKVNLQYATGSNTWSICLSKVCHIVREWHLISRNFWKQERFARRCHVLLIGCHICMCNNSKLILLQSKWARARMLKWLCLTLVLFSANLFLSLQHTDWQSDQYWKYSDLMYFILWTVLMLQRPLTSIWNNFLKLGIAIYFLHC